MRFLAPLALAVLLAGPLDGMATAQNDATQASPGEKVQIEETFENGADRWKVTDANAWKIVEQNGNHVYAQFQQSDYSPPHRSPLNIALLKDVVVGDFELTAKVQSTARDYPHRSVCLFFNYQDPAHFYYVHLGQAADDHANQIFIVNDALRTKISTKTTSGTPWDNQWHQVKIVRDTASGKIEVYFDNMEEPAMTAEDKSFTWGQIGLGSFDDTGNWDDVRLTGTRAAAPTSSE
ncbi:MAG: hypothetical protein WDZ59_11145 [Pirellulales bacterium]